MFTGDDNLVLMTQSFEPLWEIPITASTFDDNKQIAVGWGAKETQFHGSEGKEAAKSVKTKVVSLLPSDDQVPRISWHGDGQLFVVSSVLKEIGYRQLRVYDRDGRLYSTSEDIVGLEHAVHWKPSGSLITATQQHQNKHSVIFFEKNGLQHGGFTIPYKPGEVLIKELIWNADSSILAIWYEHTNQTAVEKLVSWVELWTVNNYHWYLKQTIRFDNHLKYICWDSERNYLLHSLNSDSQYVHFKYSLGVNQSAWLSPLDHGIVAVIDGSKLLITPFSDTVVPPPMSAEEIICPSSINQVMFEPSSNNIAIITADGAIQLYNYQLQDTSTNGKPGFRNIHRYRYQHLKTIASPNNNVHTHGSWNWVSSGALAFTYNLGKQSYLRKFNLSKADEIPLTLICENSVEGLIESVKHSSNTPDLILQLSDGKVLRYNGETNLIQPCIDKSGEPVKFPALCNSLDGLRYEENDFVFGLNPHYQLFCNNMQLAKDCTSFLINDEFLLFTTHQHLLRCVALKDLLKPDISTIIQKLNSREVERGSQLIISIPSDTKVILQMPRGNLETVHPRSLVLAVISKLLKSISYKEAFDMMRKNRINMNLMYDHDPELFIYHVKEFITQIKDQSSLCLFVSVLENQDFCATMYNSYCTYSSECQKAVADLEKVNSICDALRYEMESIDYEAFLLPILTCHIKKDDPEIEMALSKIQKLHRAGKLSQASKCMKHLLYIVDVNKLYDHALGMYDFAIVIMVAEKSQKDPKEYLPFLNELQKMDENYRCFKIDSHLKRHEKALGHLSKCDNNHPEFLAYMETHQLHVQALKLFPVNSEQYMNISEMYADWLKMNKMYEEAGIWFSKGNKFPKAVECFISGHNWRLAIAYAYKSEYDNKQLSDVFRQLVEQMKNSHSYLDAAHILENYLKNVEECVVMLTEGHEWEQALTTIHRNNRPDLIETNLSPSIAEYLEIISDTLTQTRASIEKHQSRLFVVREKKKQQAEAAAFDEYDGNDADVDLYSDISSVRSQSSRSSGRSRRSRMSSKSRKKMEKKKYSLKEGSQYEAEALVIAISELIDQTYKLQVEIRKTSMVLCLLSFDEKAEMLQKNFDDLLKYVKKVIPNVWPQVDQNKENLYDPSSTTNSIINSMKNSTAVNSLDLNMMRQMLPPIEHEYSWNLKCLKLS